MKWVMLFLIFSDSGLVTGWRSVHETEAACRAALQDAHQRTFTGFGTTVSKGVCEPVKR